VRLTAVADRSLEELLLAGEVDAVLSARPPAAVQRGDGRVVRLFPDAAAVEEAYFRKTGVFPIMHLLAVRRDVYEANRWLAMELLKAFEEAKERSLTRMRSFATAAVPLPWGAAHAEHVLDVLGPDPWPYGTEPNRATLETFLRYARDQGLTGRLLRPEELFVPEVQSQYRV
jgi:4,5-dihydroxyphthalate decarboxylase